MVWISLFRPHFRRQFGVRSEQGHENEKQILMASNGNNIDSGWHLCVGESCVSQWFYNYPSWLGIHRTGSRSSRYWISSRKRWCKGLDDPTRSFSHIPRHHNSWTSAEGYDGVDDDARNFVPFWRHGENRSIFRPRRPKIFLGRSDLRYRICRIGGHHIHELAGFRSFRSWHLVGS